MRDPPGPPSAALGTHESDNQLCPMGKPAPSQKKSTEQRSVRILPVLAAGPNSARAPDVSLPAQHLLRVSERDGASVGRVVDDHKSCLRCQR